MDSKREERQWRKQATKQRRQEFTEEEWKPPRGQRNKNEVDNRVPLPSVGKCLGMKDVVLYILRSCDSVEDIVALSRCNQFLYRVSNCMDELRCIRWHHRNFPVHSASLIMENMLDKMSPRAQPVFVSYLFQQYSRIFGYERGRVKFKHVTHILAKNNDMPVLRTLWNDMKTMNGENFATLTWEQTKRTYLMCLIDVACGSVKYDRPDMFKWAFDLFVRELIGYGVNETLGFVYTYKKYEEGDEPPSFIQKAIGKLLRKCLRASPSYLVRFLVNANQNIFKGNQPEYLHGELQFTSTHYAFPTDVKYEKWMWKHGLYCIAESDLPEACDAFSAQYKILLSSWHDIVTYDIRIFALRNAFNSPGGYLISRNMFAYLWNECKLRPFGDCQPTAGVISVRSDLLAFGNTWTDQFDVVEWILETYAVELCDGLNKMYYCMILDKIKRVREETMEHMKSSDAERFDPNKFKPGPLVCDDPVARKNATDYAKMFGTRK